MLRADGRPDSALVLLRAAAAIDQTLPVEFGLPNTFKPPHEAAGELLLETRRFAEAEEEFRLALERTPKRSASMLGYARAAKAQGKSADAATRYAELMVNWKRADPDLPDVAEARSGARP
jgi:predicted Zn-dependent protease